MDPRDGSAGHGLNSEWEVGRHVAVLQLRPSDKRAACICDDSGNPQLPLRPVILSGCLRSEQLADAGYRSAGTSGIVDMANR